MALGDRIPLPFILRDMSITRAVTWDDLLARFLDRSAHQLLTTSQLEPLLARGSAVILLDGLDEIGDVGVREALRQAVWHGIEKYQECRWVFTSRIAGYDDVDFHLNPFKPPAPDVRDGEESPSPARKVSAEDYARYDAYIRYVAPFDDSKIAEFARKWYALREDDQYKARREAQGLVSAVHRDRGTVRLARVPNMLTIMGLIYRIEADLPHGKARLYEQVADAYLGRSSKNDPAGCHWGEDTTEQKKAWLGSVAFPDARGRLVRPAERPAVL